MTSQYFTNACTVGHAFPVDYFHDMSSKTTAYLRNNTTLKLKLGLSKRTSKTFFVALAKTFPGYCFAVNIYYSCKLKLQITMDRLLSSLAMSTQLQFSALPQLRLSPNFPYGPYQNSVSINTARAVLILTEGPVSIDAARAVLMLTGKPVSINTNRFARSVLILPTFSL